MFNSKTLFLTSQSWTSVQFEPDVFQTPNSEPQEQDWTGSNNPWGPRPSDPVPTVQPEPTPEVWDPSTATPYEPSWSPTATYESYTAPATTYTPPNDWSPTATYDPYAPSTTAYQAPWGPTPSAFEPYVEIPPAGGPGESVYYTWDNTKSGYRPSYYFTPTYYSSTAETLVPGPGQCVATWNSNGRYSCRPEPTATYGQDGNWGSRESLPWDVAATAPRAWEPTSLSPAWGGQTAWTNAPAPYPTTTCRRIFGFGCRN
jgi:hypothetical protein